MNKVFVYGSLRKGMYNYDKYLYNNSRFVGYGYVKGSLYSLKDVNYPALLVGNDSILGEIYEVDDKTANLLDELEGYVPNDSNNHYHKIMSVIYMSENNKAMTLPVYFYNIDIEENRNKLDTQILENDFVTFFNRK